MSVDADFADDWEDESEDVVEDDWEDESEDEWEDESEDSEDSWEEESEEAVEGSEDFEVPDEDFKETREITESTTVSVYDDLIAAGFKFKSEQIQVDVNDLLTSKPVTDSRRQTLPGLKTLVSEMSIIYPIIVTPTLSFINHLRLGEPTEEYDGPKYKILDGIRRVSAALQAGTQKIPAIVIEFTDPELGAENTVVLRLILNRRQQFSIAEKWDLFESLELQGSLTPATLEWLLDLDSGQSMKFKDIMLGEYPEVIEELLSKKKTIEQAYSKLQKLRKEEDRPVQDDKRGLSNVDGSEDLAAESGGSEGRLSPDEVKEILNMDVEGDISSDDFDEEVEMFSEAAGDHVQDTANRERISPELRSAIFRRDDYTCKGCGFGEGLMSNIHLGVLQAHHIVSVYVSGNDSIDNFVTVCVRCHDMIHLLTQFDNKIGMSEEDFHKMPEHDQKVILNCRKYAKYILAAEAKTGKSLAKDKPRTLPGRTPFWVNKAESDKALKVTVMNPVQADDLDEG